MGSKKSTPPTVRSRYDRQPANANHGTDFYHVTIAILLSFLAFPLVKLTEVGFRNIEETSRTFWMMTTGFGLMLIVYWFAFKVSRVKDWLYYALTLFAFTAVIDLGIFLEVRGLLANFMSEYLRGGEPYLFSLWGEFICAFDAIVYLPIYLVLIFMHTNGKNLRSFGIYWVASILNSMLVLLVGVFSGRHPPTFCTFLNIPYVVVPLLVLRRIWNNSSIWVDKVRSSLPLKIFDAVLILGTFLSTVVLLAKTLVLLGSTSWFVKEIIRPEFVFLQQDHTDPAPFFSIQIFTFFFYVIPIQLVSLYYLFQDHKPKILWDLTLAQAGILLQGQFTSIVYTLEYVTSKDKDKTFVDASDSHFWISNLLVIIVPHLFLLRLMCHRAFNGPKFAEIKKAK